MQQTHKCNASTCSEITIYEVIPLVTMKMKMKSISSVSVRERERHVGKTISETRDLIY